MVTTPLLAILLSLASVAGGTTWYQQYEQGLRELDRGHGEAALREFQAAVAQRSEPGLKVRTYGLRYIDYLPHLYLAVTAHMAGEIELAREQLGRAERAGVAAQSREGRELLEAYRILLGTEPATATTPAVPPPPADSGRPGYADYERRPELLSDEEYRDLRQQVLVRCGLQPETEPRGAPWYYHYELGLELAGRQDPQRALDALIEAVRQRPDPQHAARMYGMWFIDYLPYFKIAKLHTILGNRECALDALRISETRGELAAEEEEYADYVRLKAELEDPQNQ